MNEAIKLAIEQGEYHLKDAPQNWENDLLLDPLFWQALGKALGWTDERLLDYHDDSPNLVPSWLYHWHRFIDWIAEGKDVDEFFRQLIESK